MWEDMQLRNYSEHTIRAYLHGVADFAKHFGTAPEQLGPEQVRTSQLFLGQEKQVAWPSVVQTVCARRFFYRVTLGRPSMLEYIAPPRRPVTLSPILSQAEVAGLLTAERHTAGAREFQDLVGDDQNRLNGLYDILREVRHIQNRELRMGVWRLEQQEEQHKQKHATHLVHDLSSVTAGPCVACRARENHH
jgi:hypothetical protein